MIRLYQTLLVATLVIVTLSGYSRKSTAPLSFTLVTGWWPHQDAVALPVANQLAALQLLFNLPFNIIFVGQPQFGKLVASKRSGDNTMFVEVLSKQLTSSWYYTRAQELKSQGQKGLDEDKVNSVLRYSRLFLLSKAGQHDTFDSDQLFWIDFNALSSFPVQEIIQPKNIPSLLHAFKHHFFLLTANKNTAHVFPNAQKTYFNTSFDTFVNGQLIGSKKEALPTINLIYEDLLRVVLQFDANLWSEDAVLSLLADRCPFLISFLSADLSPEPPKSRLLPEITQERFEIEKKQLQDYEWWISATQIVIIAIGLLLTWQIVRFLHVLKSSSQRLSKNDSQNDTNTLS